MFYFFLRTAAHIMHFFPLRFIHFTAKMLGLFIYYFVPIRKKVALINLKRAGFDNRKQIVKQSYIEMIKTFFETAYFSIDFKEMSEFVEIENLDFLLNNLKSGKQFIILSAHYGNWEILGGFISFNYTPLTAVAQRIHNSGIDRFIQNVRKDSGTFTVDRKDSRGLLKRIRAGNNVLILFDQDAKQKGINVNMFGLKTSTTKGFAVLAKKYDLNILPCFVRRDNNKLIFGFKPVIKPEDHSVEEIVQKAADELEKQIREFPDQWFWVHKRWKNYGY